MKTVLNVLGPNKFLQIVRGQPCDGGIMFN